MSLDHPYLTKQLIAYIGNKRALQPLLYRVFSRLVDGGSDALRGGGRRTGAPSADRQCGPIKTPRPRAQAMTGRAFAR